MPTGQNRQKPTLHGEAVTPGQGRKHYIWGTEQQHCNYGLPNPRKTKPQHCNYGLPTPREQNCNTTRGGGMTSRELRRTNCCGLFLFQLPFTKCHHQTPTGYPIRKASPHSQCPPGQQVSYACSTQHSRAQVLQHQKSKAQLLISQML